MTDDHALMTPEAAAQALNVSGDEFGELIHEGTLRRVYVRGEGGDEARVLGADVERVKRESDPRHLAAVVLDGVPEHEGDDSGPRALAARVPRL